MLELIAIIAIFVLCFLFIFIVELLISHKDKKREKAIKKSNVVICKDCRFENCKPVCRYCFGYNKFAGKE